MSPLSVEPETLDEPPQAKPTPQITYESAAAPISRRQFRFLLMLTFLNTLLLGFFVAGPGISRITSDWWQDYRRWQADRLNKRLAAQQQAQQRAQYLADFNAGLQFTAPESRVIYEEDPKRAANLSASGSDYNQVPFQNSSLRMPNLWQRPVKRISNDVPPISQLLPKSDEFDSSSIVFLHSRKTPNGIECLVVVTINVSIVVEEIVSLKFDPHPVTAQLS